MESNHPIVGPPRPVGFQPDGPSGPEIIANRPSTAPSSTPFIVAKQRKSSGNRAYGDERQVFLRLVHGDGLVGVV
jgi:hypothetical protein